MTLNIVYATQEDIFAGTLSEIPCTLIEEGVNHLLVKSHDGSKGYTIIQDSNHLRIFSVFESRMARFILRVMDSGEVRQIEKQDFYLLTAKSMGAQVTLPSDLEMYNTQLTSVISRGQAMYNHLYPSNRPEITIELWRS